MSDGQVKQRSREEMDPAYTWDLTPIFSSDEEMKLALKEVEADVDKIKAYEGRLNESGQVLLEAIETLHDVERRFFKIYNYTNLKKDQDTANSLSQSHYQEAVAVWTSIQAVSSYFTPELLAISDEDLVKRIEEEDGLAFYRQFFDALRQNKAHVLPKEQEVLLAKASEIFSGAKEAYSNLTNADMDFGSIEDEEGHSVPLTEGSFISYIQSTDRRVRTQAYEQLYSHIRGVKNTLLTTLKTQIKTHNFEADVRGYKSARHKALSENHVPESVYDTLVKEVNDHLHILHRYVSLRKKMLGLDNLKMSDMYVPLVAESKEKVPFEEAKAQVLEAVKPLGEDYLAIINRAFEERWIDVYENKGKRSGGYSSGMYDTNPYILLNWHDDVSNLFTLIHELGHSAHSYYTWHNQPYVYGDYPIFLAEIASTTNECLLTEYQLATETDPVKRLGILNYAIERFKSTIFRQTQFAEFEQWVHKADQNKEALTVDKLVEAYSELNRRYYGEEVDYDDNIGYEWARIPHFYYDFYVYQYATGMAAASSLADKILNEEGGVERYKNYLKAGTSDYPINVMKAAGIDMTKPDYLRQAFKVLEGYMDQLEDLLEEIKA